MCHTHPVLGCPWQPHEVDFTIIRPISQMGMLRHRGTEDFPRTPHDEQRVEMGFEPHPWGCAVWFQSLRLSSRASLRHQAALFSLLLGAICHVFTLALNCSLLGQDPWMHKRDHYASALVAVTPKWVFCFAESKREKVRTGGTFSSRELGAVSVPRF